MTVLSIVSLKVAQPSQSSLMSMSRPLPERQPMIEVRCESEHWVRETSAVMRQRIGPASGEGNSERADRSSAKWDRREWHTACQYLLICCGFETARGANHFRLAVEGEILSSHLYELSGHPVEVWASAT